MALPLRGPRNRGYNMGRGGHETSWLCPFLARATEATTGDMADTKQDVLDMLRELAELTLLDEGDPNSFRVRAYESAAQGIAAQATDLGGVSAKDLQKI